MEVLGMQSSMPPAEVAGLIFDALQRRDFEAVGRLQHDDVEDDFVPVGVYRGRAAVRGFFEELFAAVPDLTRASMPRVGGLRCAAST
jgi:ketosteroid isomerase-like protein